MTEIRKHEDINFNYVETNRNPADVASRGCNTSNLHADQLWWHGPEWLVKPEEQWELTSATDSLAVENLEGVQTENVVGTFTVKKEMTDTKQSCVFPESPPLNICCERFSSMLRLVRVSAIAMRFVKRLKGEKFESPYITAEELENAEYMWLLHVQRNNFPDVFKFVTHKCKSNLQRQLGVILDSKGLLRCKGRLENADLSENARQPILLPSKDRVTHFIIDRVHQELLHSGISHTLSQIRYKFWILRGRATVRTVLKGCALCRQFEGGPYKMPQMPSLPRKRMSESKPFCKTGLDYLGPLKIKISEDIKKVWVCLFTCMVTRAVHLEIVQDMSAKEFILCLRRFIAQRGTPEEIISDNAQQFKLASETIDQVWKNMTKCADVQNYASTKGITWSFIVELAPWMGGFYERIVSVVKRSPRKAVGRKLLTDSQFQTVIKEVEAVVNSRPLVYVGDDINSSITLTPGHFLGLNPTTGIPETEHFDEDETYEPQQSAAAKLLAIWKKGQRLIDNFWKIWKNDYLLNLRERTQTKLKTNRILSEMIPSVGDVVLIKDDLPRGQWKLSRIVDLLNSSDGQIRSAKVKTASGRIIGRPLNLLFPLETSDYVNKPKQHKKSKPKTRGQSGKQNEQNQILKPCFRLCSVF